MQLIYLSTFEWHQHFEADLFISLFWMRYPYFEAVAECHVDWNELVKQLKLYRPRLKDCVLKVLRSSAKIFKIVGRIIYSTSINNLFCSSWFKTKQKLLMKICAYSHQWLNEVCLINPFQGIVKSFEIC